MNPVKRRLAKSPAEYDYFMRGFDLDEVPQGLKPTGSRRLIGTSEDVP